MVELKTTSQTPVWDRTDQTCQKDNNSVKL